MIVVPMRRLRACIAAVLVGLLAATVAPVCAKTANPSLIPAKSAYVMSMPDTAAFWAAWKANAIYETYTKVVANPEVAGKMETFDKQLKTIEAALGFPLNGDTLSQVVSSADVYVKPGESADDVAMGAVLVVKDKAKLQKLLDLAEKAAIKASASDDESTGAAAAKAQVDEYKGVPYRHVPGEYQTPFYAQTAEKLLVANSKSEIRALIDRVKGESKEEMLSADAEFAQVAKALEAHPGEAYFLANPRQAYAMQGEVPASMKGVQNMLLGLQPNSLGGGSVKINPKDLEVYSFQPVKKDSGSALEQLFKDHAPTADISVLGYAGQNALVAGATNLFDMLMIYETVKLALSAAGTAGGADLDQQLQAAEGALGFSIKGDLMASLGNEVALVIQSVKLPGGGNEMPEVDAALIFSVKDKAKMEKVLNALEKMVGAQMGAMAGASGDASSAGFKSEKVAGDTIKYLPLPISPNLAPGFVMSGNHLLIGTSKDGMRKMLLAKKGESPSLVTSEAYRTLVARAGAQANIVQYANLTGVWNTMLEVPAMQEARPILEALRVFKTMVSVTRGDADGAMVGQTILTVN